MQMQAYCDWNYLLNISNNINIDFTDPNQINKARSQLNLADLFLNGLNIYTNASHETILTGLKNPMINKLFRDGKIRKNSLENSKTNIANGVKERIPTLYFFEKDCKPFNQQESGNFLFGQDEDASVLFGYFVEHFSKKQKDKTWEFAKEMFFPHHSLVIADPYIYTDTGFNSLRSLLSNVIPKELKCTYHISLIGCDRLKNRKNEKEKNTNDKNQVMSEIDIKSAVNEMKNWIKSLGVDINIQYFIYNGNDFHDRYLISNNLCVFSGFGVGILQDHYNNPAKEGSWVAFRPYGRINFNGKMGVFFFKVT